MRNKRWFFLGAALLLAGGGAWYALGAAASVKAVNIQQADLVQYVQATGQVKAATEQSFFAQTSAKLLHVYVKEGDRVQANQLLAELDPTDAQYKLEQLGLQLEQVQAEWSKLLEGPKAEEVKVLEESVRQQEINLEVKTREWNRLKEEYEAGAVPRAEWQKKDDERKLAKSGLDEAKHNLALLHAGPGASDEAKYQAKVKEIQLQREQLTNELQSMRIMAKGNGTVTEVPAKEGQWVAEGTELLTVADLSTLQVVSDVKETYISQIHLDQEAVIEGAAIGKEQLSARVTKMASVAKPASGVNPDKKAVVEVTLAVEEGGAKLLPGYHVDVNFVIHEAESAIQVPIGAVKRGADGLPFVWTVQGEKAVRVPVETGIKNDTFIEVKKGLAKDSLVIVNVPDSLRDHQRVTLIP
ncbi:efflux RND transporter periplasmic adaptor subunit [Brevibacillus choshinensis]|uniref:Efflux RND transporter periplasmic adaptor subunit n=1 Tax=Brevibacillus choshinensis TaxID=54911 RepID=A0ABX7FPZ2_BRECH|nr:efflux RND transporter periplasmic adaptor subunit [Brevibacillus choshinensis]QRG68311.1 efflux RND transporter periplasmic adaptor subunit [Brevibacillus choshinensis]